MNPSELCTYWRNSQLEGGNVVKKEKGRQTGIEKAVRKTQQGKGSKGNANAKPSKGGKQNK